jgi:hypothetical protein
MVLGLSTLSDRGRPLAWPAFALALALGLIGLWLAFASRPVTPPSGGDTPVSVCGAVLAVLLPFGIVGALVASRRPDNLIGWLFCAIALLSGLNGFLEGWAGYGVYGGADLPGVGVAAWGVSLLVPIPLFVGPLLLLLLFPDGRLLSRRWRLVARGVVLLVSLLIASSLRPGQFDNFPTLVNPLGVGGAVGRLFDSLDPVMSVLASVLFLAAASCLVLRLRRSRGQERLQIKWVAYAAALTATAFVATFVAPGASAISTVAFWLGLAATAGIPAAAGVAILRYRLYEIDRVINRTLVYALLTATLAAVYAGTVLLLQLALEGVTSDSGLAVAISTLAVAAAFRPARTRIQAGVDRRFYRRRYDASKTLEAFSARLREEIDLDMLARELRQAVVETMEPRRVSLWLRKP